MWARLERNEYRFVRELWRPKSFRERESLGPRWIEREGIEWF
jgi:hypothetical protein